MPDGPGPDRNLVLVVGEAAGDAVVVSAAGLPVTTFDLRVRSGSTSTLVPVRWSGQHDVVEGARLGVLGEVARRFFRAGGATQSRTEVLAVRVEHAGAAGIPKRLLGQAKRILDQ